jgi:putative Holliday junction resolvase
MRAGVRLGVDVGSVRVGIAVSDPDAVLASPLETVARDQGGGAGAPTDLARIAELAADYRVVEVVVGLPLSLSGRSGAAALAASDFARDLAVVVSPVPVRLVDERLSTVTAHDRLASAGVGSRARRGVVDKAAAVIILQSALDAERTSGRPPGQLVDAGGGLAE